MFRHTLLAGLVLCAVWHFSGASDCVYWCKSKCPTATQKYYCCTIDVNNPEPVPEICSGMIEKIIDNSRCPESLEPWRRNCLLENLISTACENNQDCKEDEVCCDDSCRLDGKRTCQQAKDYF